MIQPNESITIISDIKTDIKTNELWQYYEISHAHSKG
jgi:hypothetical protein